MVLRKNIKNNRPILNLQGGRIDLQIETKPDRRLNPSVNFVDHGAGTLL